LQVAEDELARVGVQEPPLLKVPPALPSPQVTVPVGVVGLAAVSVTVAVNVIVSPMATVDGFGVTAVIVASCA